MKLQRAIKLYKNNLECMKINIKKLDENDPRQLLKRDKLKIWADATETIINYIEKGGRVNDKN